jgi:hypothetical protein
MNTLFAIFMTDAMRAAVGFYDGSDMMCLCMCVKACEYVYACMPKVCANEGMSRGCGYKMLLLVGR